MSYRKFIADKIQKELGEGYAVYDSGVDIVKTPCVVVNPADPYLVPTTMGKDSRVQVFVQLWLVTNRTSPPDAMNHLEDMRHAVTTAIKSGSAPIGRWTQFGKFGTTQVGGVGYATAVVDAAFTAEDIGAK